ncbi:MAG: cell envelope integrity protein CreD [Ginsengibacter sp.]
MKTAFIAFRIWFFTGILFGLSFMLYHIVFNMGYWVSGVAAVFLALIGSLPVFISLLIILPFIKRTSGSLLQKKIKLFLVCAVWCIIYSIPVSFLVSTVLDTELLMSGLVIFAALLMCSFLAMAISFDQLSSYFNVFNQSINKNNQMETNSQAENLPVTPENPSNKILWKSIITGVLILVLLIPAAFISNLVSERKARQADVVTEVSQKWAQSQLLTGPYIYLPYKTVYLDKDKKENVELHDLVILPETLEVDGKVSHEVRKRSIYKVLLYRADLMNKGQFEFKIPKGIDKSSIQWQDAKICYGLSDFKGIEEKMVVQFNGTNFELSPGLPTSILGQKGLSASIPFSAENEGISNSFKMNVKIKGSEQLHFQPYAGNSRFSIKSDWKNPSFDGSDLPSQRVVNDSGFIATWNFNKANLPFGTVLDDFKLEPGSFSFGVTLVQPADGYAKTDRSIKYAILFIGLTFSLFFIIELLQKKPIHPVQYVLIGLALIIFYTLLLSMSEFIAFDLSYLIAALATIMLISFYAYGHFKSVKTASVFGSVLVLLYGFTFVLIRLEDTALLLGSVGLFIILALAMYASRKVNWYGQRNIAAKENNISGLVN